MFKVSEKREKPERIGGEVIGVEGRLRVQTSMQCKEKYRVCGRRRADKRKEGEKSERARLCGRTMFVIRLLVSEL